MSLQIDMSGLADLAWLLNSMALIIALAASWLLVATRWRRQLFATQLRLAASRMQVASEGREKATRRVNRAFYAIGFSSLGLAWLLSMLTRLA